MPKACGGQCQTQITVAPLFQDCEAYCSLLQKSIVSFFVIVSCLNFELKIVAVVLTDVHLIYVSKYSHLSNTYVTKEVEIKLEGVQMFLNNC